MQEVMKEVGLEKDSRGLDAPIEQEVVEDGAIDDESELLEPTEARRYRAVAATINFLSLDRADVQFAAKEICRTMSRPRLSGWARVKRLARYLAAHPRLKWKFTGDTESSKYLDVFSDSDWAGNRRNRKSTSGGVAAIDGGAIKHLELYARPHRPLGR